MSDQESEGGQHHPRPLSPAALRAKAIESLLVEKGLLASDAIDRVVEIYEKDVGPLNGAKVVARAWCDPDYKRHLLQNATAAIAEIGFGGLQGEHLMVLENTSRLHNVVCCTLCSCYPWPVLGLPPTWYKSLAYRARIVREPRAVLREFGLDLPEAVEIRVWDSSSEMRYMVLPERPPGTAEMSEAELTALITRDALIGVARVEAPAR
jgi:nitrile hydratase